MTSDKKCRVSGKCYGRILDAVNIIKRNATSQRQGCISNDHQKYECCSEKSEFNFMEFSSG